MKAMAWGIALLIVAGGGAIAQQDKYALKIGDLAFADFRGYENWGVVAVSQADNQMKMIVANDVMLAAYAKGLPADGKQFPEGSKIVKIVWSLKKDAKAPDPVNVPDALLAVATIEKDSKRFAATSGWGSGVFSFDAAKKVFVAQGTAPTCAAACHSKVAVQDHIFTALAPR